MDSQTKLMLEKKAVEIRKDIVTAVHSAKSGHPGGSLSIADTITYLYFYKMNVNPNAPARSSFSEIKSANSSKEASIPV